jgi:hypothetical protein
MGSVPFDRSQDIDSAAIRQLEIEHDSVRFALREQLKGFVDTCRLADNANSTRRGEHSAQPLADE